MRSIKDVREETFMPNVNVDCVAEAEKLTAHLSIINAVIVREKEVLAPSDHVVKRACILESCVEPVLEKDS